MARTPFQHSVPTWVVSPHRRNPKFGGGDPDLSLQPVAERLRRVKRLESKVKTADGLPLLSSFHICLELQTGVQAYSHLNGDGAIGWDELVKGIRDGDFPEALALTAPCFGFAGAERGGILSPNKADQQRGYDLNKEASDRTLELKALGLGKGKLIWWPAFDCQPVGIAGQTFDIAAAKMKFVAFWVDLLGKNPNAQVWFEYKPGDPGIDVIRTMKEAIAFAKEVNRQLGRKAVLLNNEWAHILASGITIKEGTKRTIDADLFDGFVHVNMGERYPEDLEKVIDEGRPTGVSTDWDWHVGYFQEQADLDDQLGAVKLLNEWGGEGDVVYAEHDLWAAEPDVFAYAERSINGLEGFIAQARAA